MKIRHLASFAKFNGNLHNIVMLISLFVVYSCSGGGGSSSTRKSKGKVSTEIVKNGVEIGTPKNVGGETAK